MRLVIFMLLWSVLGHAQTIGNSYADDSKVVRGINDFYYERVIPKEGEDKSALWGKMRKVIIELYKNPREVVEESNYQTGVMIIKGSEPYTQSNKMWGGSDASEGSITYTLEIGIKDGKYRYILKDWRHEARKSFAYIHRGVNGVVHRGTSKGWRLKIWNDLQKRVEALSARLSEDIEKEMGVKEEEW